MSFFDKIREGLRKTRESTAENLNVVLSAFRRVDEDLLDELEEAMILADFGAEAAAKTVQELGKRAKLENLRTKEQVVAALCDILKAQLPAGTGMVLDSKPSVILVTGVNGVGKTTSIGKLAAMYGSQGKKVLLAAADTFRAAAADQLAIWASRSGADLVRHGEGADPSAVIFDALTAAKARGADIVICDTAGRLHNKQNLMNELSKMNRVIDREAPGACRENLLVLDATTGQNAMLQAEAFDQVTRLTGIILTKLDGTAKGGIAVHISAKLNIPIKFVGVGEKADDLLPFDSGLFVQAFFQ